MPYKNRLKQRAFNLARNNRARAEWFKGKSCWKCGATEKLELEWLGTGEKNHRVWSMNSEKRALILVNYRASCRCHRVKGREHVLTPKQVQLIRETVIKGYGVKAAGRILGHGQRTIERYLEKMEIPKTSCACGKNARHQGICWWRLTLDQLGLDDEIKEELRQWQRARAFLNKTKAEARKRTTVRSPLKYQAEGLRQAPTSPIL